MNHAAAWSVVIPLKRLEQAKSRLGHLPVPLRGALTIAMARDVLDAVLECAEVRQVVVVTRDQRWRGLLGRSGVDFLADDAADSLNDALRRGASMCRATQPRARIAALTGDLPALRPEELGQALRHAQTRAASFMPDAHGEGTTLFAAAAGVPFSPHYGSGSRARHIQEGAHEILLPGLGGLRQDVDTLDDLERARALGLGPHTRACLAELTESRSSTRSSTRPLTQLDSTFPTGSARVWAVPPAAAGPWSSLRPPALLRTTLVRLASSHCHWRNRAQAARR